MKNSGLQRTDSTARGYMQVNASTGVATRVRLMSTFDIVGLEYSNGSFWALGTVWDSPSVDAGPGQPQIAELDPHTGATTMVANLTALVGEGTPLRVGWSVIVGEGRRGRACHYVPIFTERA